jgi:hypothetical protein
MAGSRRPGVQGGSSTVAELDSGTLCRVASPSPGAVDAADTALTPEQRALITDVAQIALDLAGIVDPTPTADVTNAVISATRSDWSGAGLSLIGVIPYLGDLAKAGKLPRWLATMEKCIVQAGRSQRFATLVRPLLTRIYQALDALPLNAMPPSLRRTLDELRGKLSALVGAPARLARARGLLADLRGKVDDPDMVLDLIESTLGRHSPTPGVKSVDDYLAALDSELANFAGKPTLRVTARPEAAVRASDTVGGALTDSTTGQKLLKADDMGRYLVPASDLSLAVDRNASAVAQSWNKMSAVELQEIPAGSLVVEGLVRAQAGLAGGGQQIFHLGQMSADGRILRAAERRILDGVTRLPGGQLSGTH